MQPHAVVVEHSTRPPRTGNFTCQAAQAHRLADGLGGHVVDHLHDLHVCVCVVQHVCGQHVCEQRVGSW